MYSNYQWIKLCGFLTDLINLQDRLICLLHFCSYGYCAFSKYFDNSVDALYQQFISGCENSWSTQKTLVWASL